MQYGYPIHYYLQFLKYGADALREMTFDSMRVVNTVRLPVSDYKSVVLPCDFVDWIKVGYESGQYIVPLVAQDAINRLNKFDDAGAKTTFGDASDTIDTILWPVGYQTYFNNYGEWMGGVFGHGAGYQGDTFKFLPERNEIQLNEALALTEIVLEYVSDGQTSTASTRIDPYAQSSIEAYIDWKYKSHSTRFGPGEVNIARAEFYNQHRIYRARKNPLTPEKIKRIFNQGYKAVIKP